MDERISNAPAVDEKGKSMSYFAIDDAIAVNRQKNGSSDRATPLDKDTREMLIASVKTLIFAGHDTSASTLCVSPPPRHKQAKQILTPSSTPTQP